MKKSITILLAATMLTASIPAFASTHGASHDAADVQCARDCELLLKNCAQEVDSIQQRIARLKEAVKKQGADSQKVAEVRRLQQKLDQANELLRTLEKGGH